MSTTSLRAPSAAASAPAAVSALRLCTTPSASGATVEMTGIRPAAIRSVTAPALTAATSPTRPTSTASPSTVGRAARRGEQPGVLAGHADRERAVLVDQPDQLPADLADQHHPDHVDRLRRGDPQPAAELAVDAEPVQHGRDLRAAAVHHDRPEPDVAQEDQVGREGPLHLRRRSSRCRRT